MLLLTHSLTCFLQPAGNLIFGSCLGIRRFGIKQSHWLWKHKCPQTTSAIINSTTLAAGTLIAYATILLPAPCTDPNFLVHVHFWSGTHWHNSHKCGRWWISSGSTKWLLLAASSCLFINRLWHPTQVKFRSETFWKHNGELTLGRLQNQADKKLEMHTKLNKEKRREKRRKTGCDEGKRGRNW